MLTPLDHTEIAAALDGLDDTANSMERKWGLGRLRLVVGDELRAKFDRQSAILDKFLWSPESDRQTIIDKIQAMKRAWIALDQTATQSGYEPRPPALVECPLPGGGVAVIAWEGVATALLNDYAKGRAAVVYTIEEIGRMIEAARPIMAIKEAFPGAKVEAIRVKRPTELEMALGDTLVF